MEVIAGITLDISEWLDFHIYKWVHYKTNAGLGPQEIGRWLGISHKTGPMLTYWILPKSGIPISCDTVQHVTRAERETEEVKVSMENWTRAIQPIMEARSSVIIEPEEQNLFDIDCEGEEFANKFRYAITHFL